MLIESLLDVTLYLIFKGLVKVTTELKKSIGGRLTMIAS